MIKKRKIKQTDFHKVGDKQFLKKIRAEEILIQEENEKAKILAENFYQVDIFFIQFWIR